MVARFLAVASGKQGGLRQRNPPICCSDGGLAVALAECCIANKTQPLSASIDLDAAYSDMHNASNRGVFFGETQGRYVISSSAPIVVEKIAAKHGVPIHAVGIVLDYSEEFSIRLKDQVIRSRVKELSDAWHNAIPSIMSSSVVAPAAAESPELASV